MLSCCQKRIERLIKTAAGHWVLLCITKTIKKKKKILSQRAEKVFLLFSLHLFITWQQLFHTKQVKLLKRAEEKKSKKKKKEGKKNTNSKFKEDLFFFFFKFQLKWHIYSGLVFGQVKTNKGAHTGIDWYTSLVSTHRWHFYRILSSTIGG